MNIDFDSKINDPNKILFLVKNVLGDGPSSDQFLSCDCFDESECHHLPTHSNDSFDLNQNRMSSKCSYCQFYDFLNKNFTTFKTNMEKTKSSKQTKHVINLRFKKRYYTSDILEWCNVFTWKSPFALMAFASCQTDADIYNSIKKFQQEKDKLKKTLITSKLFIDVHKKHEMSEEFQKTICKHGAKEDSLVPNHPKIDLDSISTMDSSLSLLAQTSLDNVSCSQNDSLSLAHPDSSLNLVFPNQSSQNDIPQGSTQTSVNEAELKNLLTSMQKEIVYLDFIFAKNIDDTFNALIETDKTSISNSVSQCVDHVLANFGEKINDLGHGAEKRLNYFWNHVKTPIEKKNDETEVPRGLSISMLNETDILGRLKKIKGDYYFMMNHLEQAVNCFSQACEKISDTVWYSSAFESLYASSYLFDKNKTNSNTESSSSSNKNAENKQKTLKKIAQLFKKNKDQSQILESIDHFKNYMDILNHYLAKKETRLFALEAGLMITKFFMEKNLKVEALEILKQLIYISNVNINEEEKIRRYLEISLIYENFGMHHQAAFYKYISSGRIFRLIENNSAIIRSSYFKCLLRRCIEILRTLFDVYHITQQGKEETVVGFPEVKIRILLNVIKLYQYDSNVPESIKYIKYLIHELSENLSNSSIQSYFETFTKLMELENKTKQIKDDSFYTKFFKFPIINSFNPIVFNSELNKSMKIEYLQPTNSIYIHRYQSVCPSNRKPKKFTLPADHLNQIEITLANPLPIPTKIEQFSLVVEDMEFKLMNFINLVKYDNPNDSEIILEPISENIKLNLAFNFPTIGTFRVIGYKIKVFNCEDIIYFNEISKNNKNKYSISKYASYIQNFFDFNMVPNLPLIKDINLYELNENKDSSILRFGLSESKNLVIDLFFGNNKNFKIDLSLEYQVKDMQILNLKLNILNEQIMKNLKLSVSLVKEENIYLKIDSTNFAFDVKPNELELNSYLEIKYTNKVGAENNLCNLFKIQTTVKFTQAILARIVDINDLNENEFELVLNVENLLEDNLIKCFFNDTQIEIQPKASSTIQTKIKKFDLESLFGYDNYNASSVDNLNRLMNISFMIEATNEAFKVILSEQGTNLKPFLSKIFRFPFGLKSIVKFDKNSPSPNTSTFKYYSMMLLTLNKPELKCMHGHFNLNAKILSKIKNYHVRKNFTWIFDSLSSDYWYKELKLIRKSDDAELFDINFELKSLVGNEIIRWCYSFNVDNFLCYIPVK